MAMSHLSRDNLAAPSVRTAGNECVDQRSSIINQMFHDQKPTHRAAGADAAVLKQAIEDGTVVTDVEFGLFLDEIINVVRGNTMQEFDVFVCMELRHFSLCCRFRSLSKRIARVDMGEPCQINPEA